MLQNHTAMITVCKWLSIMLLCTCVSHFTKRSLSSISEPLLVPFELRLLYTVFIEVGSNLDFI